MPLLFHLGGGTLLIEAAGAGWLLLQWAALEGFIWWRTFTDQALITLATLVALVLGIQLCVIGLLADLLVASQRLTRVTDKRIAQLERHRPAGRSAAQEVLSIAEGELGHDAGGRGPAGAGDPHTFLTHNRV